MWNTEGINRLAVKLGTIQGIQPYRPCARQTEYITIYILTKHPRHIPKFLKAKEGDHDKSIKVKVLAWRLEEPTNFPPPPPPPRRRQQVSRPQQQQPQTQRPPSPNIHSYSGESSVESNYHPWARSRPISGQANMINRKPAGIWVPKVKAMPVQPRGKLKTFNEKETVQIWTKKDQRKQHREEVQKQIAKLLHTMRQPEVHTGRMEITPARKKRAIVPQHSTQKVTIQMGFTVNIFMGSVVAARVAIFKPQTTSLAYQMFTYIKWDQTALSRSTVVGKAWGNSPKVKVQGQIEIMRMLEAADKMVNDQNKVGANSWQHQKGKGNSCYLQRNLFAGQTGLAIEGPQEDFTNTSTDLTVMDPNDIGSPNREEHTISPGFEEPFSASTDDGPELPPGFDHFIPTPNEERPSTLEEGPPEENYNNTQSQNGALHRGGKPRPPLSTPRNTQSVDIRRSPRIKTKMDGQYIPMMERAKKVLGYEVQAIAKKKKNKAKGADKPGRAYAETLDPLSEVQAELVVSATGIEMDETLEEKVHREVIKLKTVEEATGDATLE